MFVTHGEFTRTADNHVNAVFELLVNATKLFAGIWIRAISNSPYLNTNLCPVTAFRNIETAERVIRLLLPARARFGTVSRHTNRSHQIEYDVETF